ncbi:MAG: sulfotransferase family 2 domain-containing protein [Bacteroidota bacterium]
MLYSSKQQFLFIHIYKTGGNSVRKVLEPYADGYNLLYKLKGLVRQNHVLPSKLAPKHANAQVAKAAVGEQLFNSSFKFAFVRNPWDWQVSLYHFALRDKSNHHHKIISAFPNFDTYLSWRVNEELRLQKAMITDENGDIIVNYVGRFERLQEDFNAICKNLKLPISDLPLLNKGNRKDYRSYYNEKTAKMVERAYAEDISTFGYSF